MEQLRLLPLIVTLLAAAVAVLVLVLASSSNRGQDNGLRGPEGYVACDARYLGRSDQGCVEAGPSTPKDEILYCEVHGTAVISSAWCSSSSQGPRATAHTTGPLAQSGGYSILLPAAALLLGAGVLTYTILRRGR